MDKKTKNGIITVGVIAALGLVGYKLLKKPKGIPEPNRGGGVDPNSGGGITNPPPPSPSSNIDAAQLANDLFDAFDGYGTDNGVVTDTFSALQTDADFNALVAAYATRTVSSGFGNIFASNFSGGLIATLKQECSSGERQAINQILADKGITKRI
jgi:hypothetical protein